MTIEQAKSVRPGTVLSYDDGRDGHRGVRAIVLSVAEDYLIAQFEDRADTTKVGFIADWLSHFERKLTKIEYVRMGRSCHVPRTIAFT